MELRPYQAQIVETLLSPPEGITRSLVCCATGGGKTIVFAKFLDAFLKKGERALILAHRTELLTQAVSKLAQASPSLHVEREQANLRASKKISGWSKSLKNIDRSVVVGSIQTMKGKRLESWDKDTFAAIIIDEAHHSVANVYVDVLKHFGCMDGKTRLVGVTATPSRTDGVGLGFTYQEISADWGIVALTKLGFLCPLTGRRITSEISLDGIKLSHGDFAQGELERRIDVSDRNELIVSAWEEHALGRQTIVFAAGVGHSHHIAELFRARGHKAMPVWGEMDPSERKKTLEDYHSGAVSILTNFGVLTEGFDAPRTSCVVLGRPTKSALVVAQCIGRGTRIAEGKKDCLVLDVRDTVAGKSLATAATLAGLPPNFDAKGKNLIELAEEFEALPEPLKKTAIDADALGEFVAKVKKGMTVAEIDLFAALPEGENIRSHSKLAWLPEGEGAWAINADHVHYTLGLVPFLGNFVFARNGQVMFQEPDQSKAFHLADAWISEKHAETTEKLLDTTKAWRRDPATPAQIKLLKRMKPGLDFTKTTKGEAGKMISSMKGHRYGTNKNPR